MKVPRLSSFWIVALVTWLLFLAGMTLTQAQAETKAKPPAPTPAKWTVRIPAEGTGPSGSTMGRLYGDGKDYINGTDNVEVTVQYDRVRGSLGRYATYIGFRINNPTSPTSTSRHVHFNGVSLGWVDPSIYGDSVAPDSGRPCCVFPGSTPGQSPGCADFDCMADFVNNPNNLDVGHPYRNDTDEVSAYRFFLIEIDAFDMNLDLLGINEPYHLGQAGHYNDYIVVRMMYETAGTERPYHSIDLQKSAGEQPKHPFNVWITRTGPSTWTVNVGKDGAPQFLFAEEWYYERTGERRILSYSTLFQGGDFYFTFDLIKNGQ